MVVKISDMPEALVLNETDEIEIEQAGVSKKLTKKQLRSLLFKASPAPVLGDYISYDGTDFVATAPVPPLERWTVIDQIAYTESGAITWDRVLFDGGAPSGGVNRKASDYFSVGLPVRVEIGAGVFYYGMCSAVSTTLLTVSNAIFPSAGSIIPASPIISLAFGTLEMVKHVSMAFVGTNYNTSTTLVLTNGCQHRWIGPTGHLVEATCSHMNTAFNTVVNLHMNGGSPVLWYGMIPGAGTATTHGAFSPRPIYHTDFGTLTAANAVISHNQTITAKTPVRGDAPHVGDFLIINMTFVVP